MFSKSAIDGLHTFVSSIARKGNERDRCLTLAALVQRCKMEEARQSLERQKTRPKLKRIFRIIPFDDSKFSIPRLVKPFKANLKDQKMITFNQEKKEFRFSCILCSCLNCLMGNFESCGRNRRSILKIPFKQFETTMDEPVDEILNDDEPYENMNVVFSNARNEISGYLSDDFSSIQPADLPQKLLIDDEVSFLNASSKSDTLPEAYSDNEFHRGGSYSNFTMDRIFQIFYEENEKLFSEITILTCIETALIINNFFNNDSVPPEITFTRVLETKVINFERNYLICPVFSTSNMKNNNTLQTSEGDKEGHWVLLICDFFLCKAFLVDGLGPDNSQISEIAVKNLAGKIFRAISAFRPIEGFNQDEDIILEVIPMQRKF